MKWIVLLLFPCFAHASEYKFTYNFEDGKQLKVKMEGKNRWDALEKAGLLCGKLMGVGEKDLTEDEVAEITTVCANPSMN